MLEALKRAEREEHDAPPTVLRTVSDVADSGPILVDTEEIPFIEVGPHRSLEASPSVLACTPTAPARTPREEPAPAPRIEPHPPIAPPRSVHFRPLPGHLESRGRFAPELVAYHAPDDPAARPYRDVLDAVLNAAAANDQPAALLFTPALPRCGNTTTLLNLAITAARRGRRVLVVDANLRQPGIAARLGLSSAPGLREALAGVGDVDTLVRPTEQANLLALTAGAAEAGPGPRFVAETMRSLLRRLRQRSALIFVDGPRWDGRPDVTTLGAACDAVFLVVHETEAETPQTDALLRLIPEQGARLAGCVLLTGCSPLG
jgi:Mrp family chromosome partitioning ATPase